MQFHSLDFIKIKLKQFPLLLPTLGLLACGLLVACYTYKSSKQVVFQLARETAEKQAASITNFRNFYAQELVPRAIRAGIAIAHNYKDSDKTLPLPATLIIELGHYLSKEDAGTKINLYSDMPFPWRKKDQNLDKFQKDALSHLNQYPDIPYVREDVINGTHVLRYAQADRMLSGCVTCHNNYEGSPKTDWKINDVRGVLEISLPIEGWQSASSNFLTRTFIVLLLAALAGIFMVWQSMRRIRKALLIAHDVSVERQFAIHELRLSESKLHSIFESVPEAIVVADQKGMIVQCNLATGEMFGYLQGELIGENISILMQDSEKSIHDSYIEAYHKTGKKNLMNQPRVVLGMKRDKSTFPIRLTINETRVENSHVFIGVMQDYSAPKRTQELLIEAKEKAEQANRLRGEFLANMSHEIRTPMNGILGMTELAMNTEDVQTQKEYLSLARDSASHLLHIINQILDFSKIEANALDLEIISTNIANLLRDTTRSLDQLAAVKNIKLELFIDEKLPEKFFIDPIRLRQVLTNLIGNSIKFTETGGIKVTCTYIVSSCDGSSMLKISVSDTGIGFNNQKLESLFSPFMQADGSTTRLYGGTGLGLAITRSLIHLMGGRISGHSTPGHGATFEIFIPAKMDLSEIKKNLVTDAPLKGQKSERSLNVLLVEDHAINRKLAEIMLQRMGHRFIMASNGEEALKYLEKEKFDVVLMDVMMPVMDGITALKIWRKQETERHLKRTPILMVTAHAMTGDSERFLAAGADGYVPKPISESALHKEIVQAMRLAISKRSTF